MVTSFGLSINAHTLLMKKFLLVALSFISTLGMASHIKGGQIYWDALGNNQYKLVLEVYSECSGIGPAMNQSVRVGQTTVTLNLVSDTYMSPGCNTCMGIQMKVARYEATGVTINVSPGTNYASVTWESFSRGISTNISGTPAFLLESKLYAGGVNKSSARFNSSYLMSTSNSSDIYLFTQNPSLDSVNIALTPSKVRNSSQIVPVTYLAGYSASHPVSPNDFLFPTGYFYAGGVMTGSYFVSFMSSGFDQFGVQTSDVQIEITYNNSSSTGSTNNPPTVAVNPSLGNFQTQDSLVYKAVAYPGDSILVFFYGSDSDLNPNFVPQNITAQLHSFSYPNGPNLAPIAPQSGMTSAMTNNVSFEWILPSTIAPGTYNFVVRMSDNYCPTPGHTARMIQIKVPDQTFAVDTFGICAGGAVQLASPVSGSVFSWMPTNGLNNPSSAVVSASPSSTTTYTLTVDGVVRAHYTVEVGQHVTPVLTQTAASQLVLTNASSFDAFAFLYYYVPIAYNTSPLSITASGLYHAVGQNAGCYDLSDSLVVAPDSLNGVYLISQAVDSTTFVNFSAQDSYSIDLNIGGADAALGVQQIILPGAQVTGKMGNVHLRITGQSSTYDVNGVSLDGHSLAFYLPSEEFFISSNSRVELVIDSGNVQLPLIQGLSLPHYFNDLGIVYQIQGSLNGVSLSDDLIPMAFRGAWSVGMEEWDQQVKVYPQPANDRIVVEGISQVMRYSLIDLNGRMLEDGMLDSTNGIDVSSFSNGVYMLQLSTESALKTLRVVVQH